MAATRRGTADDPQPGSAGGTDRLLGTEAPSSIPHRVAPRLCGFLPAGSDFGVGVRNVVVLQRSVVADCIRISSSDSFQALDPNSERRRHAPLLQPFEF